MRNKNNHSTEPAIQSSRRQILGFTTKGSALLAAKTWVAPSILAVTLPLHAQASPGTTNGPGTTPGPGTTLPLSCPGPESSSGSTPLTLTSHTNSISLGQYDLPVGNLSIATLEYVITVSSDFSLDNNESMPITVDLTSSAEAIIVAPDGTTLLNITPSITETGINLAETDSIPFNFLPPSGLVKDGVQVIESGSIDLLAAGINPNLFIGSGNVIFSVSANGRSSFDGAGNVTFDVQTSASFELTINYACEL